MLAAALADDDDLYWEMDATKPPSPKRKCPQAEEESLDDSVSTVKTAMSTKKPPKSALKGSTADMPQAKSQACFATSDSQMVTSQATSILQLTEMVSTVQQENKTIMARFDQLMDQIAALLSAQPHPTQHPAGGHGSESSHPT